MWVAKMRVDGSNSFFGSRTKKHNILIKGYPLSSSIDQEDVRVYSAIELVGEDKNIHNFIEDIVSSKEIIDYECCGRFLIFLAKRDNFFKIFYDMKILQLKPVTILPTGENIFEIGAFQKETLMGFINTVETNYVVKLDYICKKNVDNISIISPYPSITPKQKDAFELAIKNGYYDFPKKIDLKRLAEMKGLSFSTFRAHLKKAENKIIKFMFGHL